MLGDLRRLIATFPQRSKMQLCAYMAAQFVASLLDLLGVAMVLPILQVLSGAPLEEGSIGTVHSLFGSPPRREFVVLLCVAMMAAFVAKAGLSMALQWWSLGFIARLQTATQARLMRHYLAIDYLDYRRRNTGELGRIVGSAVGDAHNKVLGGFLSIATWSVQALLLFGFLLLTAPVPAMVAVVYLTLVVVVMQRGLSPRNRRVGALAQQVEWDRSMAVVEAFRGLRDVRLHNAQDLTVQHYDSINRRGAEVVRTAGFLGSMPRQVLELATIVGLAVLLLAVTLSSGSESDIAVLGIFVAASLKLLPAVTALTAAWGAVRQGQEGLRITVESLDLASSADLQPTSSPSLPTRRPRAELIVNNVSFKYPDGATMVLDDVSFVVPSGASLAICGSSGSGKTTLADIILGLLRPSAGEVLYGQASVLQGQAHWYETIAYVPQDVYIFDSSVLENVAFGVPREEIDEKRVEQCLREVQLEEVVAGLPDGVLSAIGERGMRLSGGQRQRLGIARALYRHPSVILLDEATSALDNATEREITDTIASLRGDVTTIIIAHRLSTVKHVDELVFLEGGRVAARGTFAQVCAQSPSFARLVELGSLDVDGHESERVGQ